MLFDTIAAISTPLGEGGIGIVRISGEKSLEILEKVFRTSRPRNWRTVQSHTIHYGHVVEQKSGEVVDEVLVSVMRGPRTFTAEDVVEINCHGGIVPLQKTLELVLQEGARLAEPGEFTKRAFLNGRIDLSQAEAVIDIIRARTDQGLKVALNQLAGALSAKVKNLREELLGLLAFIEAGVDFPEEDVQQISLKEIGDRVIEVKQQVKKLLSGAYAGRIYREGFRMVIAGKPNVGKSSLLNALLRERRAIVTDIPGTTRDVIEEVVNLRGIPVRIIDTAGIRDTTDVVERLGVEKTREWLAQADLVLLVMDAASGITREDREILGLIGEQRVIILVNKIDVEDPRIDKEEVMEWAGDRVCLEISAREEIGLEELADTVVGMVLEGKVVAADQGLVTRVRHQESLQRAARHLEQVEEGVLLGFAQDLLSIDLKAAWEALGEITGDTLGEDVLDRIFAEFCIGK